ncbi:SprT family protein [Aquisalibacillus elongatus]|uniref:SprT-like protein n=1 Tax=Aquisalibacillus elongatus TaxID=485577 RepID=A0A3N5BH31_9BACI|nr:SprT family protein [Aquisalibacillus elongatus]RPF57104.1 SprT-like protein [Aquisalibacillus elongatus]
MDQELLILIKEVSKKYFDKPFIGDARFNKRLRTTGGRYIPHSQVIEINPKYLTELGYDELIGIIKHELAHYHLHIEGKPYHHRSKDFRSLLKETGAPRFCKILPSEEKKPRLIYECQNCGQQYKRKRRIDLKRYRCGRCNGQLKQIH